MSDLRRIGPYNAERYRDPTPYLAINGSEAAVTKPCRPLVYICSPLRGDVERNTRNACRYARFAVGKGVIPFAPHLHYPRFMDDGDPRERSLAMAFGLTHLSKCDQIWVFGNTLSEGMRHEVQYARRYGIPVRYFNEKCEEAHR
jgi:hypothetical protein